MKPVAWMNPEHLEQYRSGEPCGIAWASPERTDFYSVPLAALPEAPAVPVGVTLAQLQRAHIERQEEWCPDQKPDLSFRGNEMAGEVGEACNVIKKLERERHGWRGSRATKEQLAEELGDVIHTAILCAITAGIDLELATVAKFNATSEKNGLSHRIALQSSPPVKATAVDGPCPYCDGLGEYPDGKCKPCNGAGKVAALASQHAVEGEAVAWRWRWADASEDDGWTYTHRRPKSDPTLIIEPLYTSHRPAVVSPLPLTGAEP